MEFSAIFSVSKAVLRLSRPWAWLTVIVLAIASRSGTSGDWGGEQLVSSAFVLLLMVSAGFALNDYYDRTGDSVIHPERVIPKGLLQPVVVLLISLALFGSALGVAWIFQADLWAYVVVATLLLVVYSPLKNVHGLLGNVVVAFLIALVVPYSAGNITLSALALGLAVGVFLAILSRELVKDVEDMRGEASSRRTLPMAIGVRGTYRSASVVLIGASVCVVGGLLAAGHYFAFLALVPVVYWTFGTARDYWFAREEDAVALLMRTRRGLILAGVVLATVRA